MVIRIDLKRWIVVLSGVALVLAVAATAPRWVRPAAMPAAMASCGEEPRDQAVGGVATVLAWLLPSAAGSSTEPLQINDPARLHILIDRYQQELTLFEGPRRVATFPVAVGKINTPSPPGEWRVVHKSRDWGGGFGTRWLGLNVPWGIYGIHGTNKPGSIGTEASAGCIRMFNRHVEQLWDVVPEGTPVVITGQLPEVAPRPQIEQGVSGKAVTVLQFRLRQAGFDYGPMDGRFGPAVAEAVRNLQALYGLPADGKLTRDQQRLLWFPK